MSFFCSRLFSAHAYAGVKFERRKAEGKPLGSLRSRLKQTLGFQDWPPQRHFRTEFPQLFEAFASGCPCPDLTRYNGILNLASHYPTNSAVVPDLGRRVVDVHAVVDEVG